MENAIFYKWIGSGGGPMAHQPRKSSPKDQDWLKAVGRFIAWFAPNCEATVPGPVSHLVSHAHALLKWTQWQSPACKGMHTSRCGQY